ncbi:hypothetical protein UO65_2797 [Actinokineospora spheciospongiae]|uniref:Uncharacterized protein n=1 Tax=Actinokineospora spheciospongiae TaxID=909613 RepID=W7J739_9PSEU|nr:hypothetical protein UO65_2797 [Actinokineospora spheciospongiae]
MVGTGEQALDLVRRQESQPRSCASGPVAVQWYPNRSA